jgi:hypothetical protein
VVKRKATGRIATGLSGIRQYELSSRRGNLDNAAASEATLALVEGSHANGDLEFVRVFVRRVIGLRRGGGGGGGGVVRIL